jgi:N-acetylmuramoyl-L-alanine amidase
MTPTLKRRLTFLVLAVLSLVASLWFASRKPEAPPVPPPAAPEPPVLTSLAPLPDWSALETYQQTITRAEFERLLTTVFTTGTAWQQTIQVTEAQAVIRTDSSPGDPVFILRFAAEGQEKPSPRTWRTAAELPPAPADKPLAGLRIAIDPGHIGGEWAQMEERWMVVGDGTPVCEGDMTLHVANLLKPMLEALGATVSLVREKPEPVTPIRPDDLLTLARESGGPNDSPEETRKTAERLFYRTAEIHARAQRVNQTLKPDLVLCLHFNADPWGDANNPTLVDRTHLHLLLNGAYTDDELPLPDQRFALLQKLLQRTHQEEALVGATVADTFAAATGLPPFLYPPNSPNVLPVGGHPYLWARNLLANRLYDCPVIFMEPYVMNSTIDYPRLQAGDYDGLRKVSGKMQPSIFREYADALTAGLAKYYGTARSVSAE